MRGFITVLESISVFSLPVLFFGLCCIIIRIINGPPSGGNASQVTQYNGGEDEHWQYNPHKANSPERIIPTIVDDPYWDSHSYSSHGPGPTHHGPGPHYDG